MLKHIPDLLTPELLKILMEMGHGDELVIGDGNFPSASIGRRVVRLDGHGIPAVLDAVMRFFPLDQYDEKHAILMEVVPGDTVETPIWEEYDRILRRHDEQYRGYSQLERFAFYERAREAYAVIHSGETALYANIILKKGVVVHS